jgi:hypothetical protein
MPDGLLKPTIFLDTNSVHNITSYLILARRYNLHPFHPHEEIPVIRSTLEGKGLPNGLVDGLISGLRTLAYLQTQVENDDAQIYSSRFTIAELWNGRLDGQAHIRMAAEGVPFRQRQKSRELAELVRDRLTLDDYTLVSNELNSFQEDWKKYFGIEIMFAEDDTHPIFRDISLLALEIQKVTFLDVIDCYLYASSLALLATSFITCDAYLFKTMNFIKNPSQITDATKKLLWQEAQNAILEGMKNTSLNDTLTASDITLPKKASRLGDDISTLHILIA